MKADRRFSAVHDLLGRHKVAAFIVANAYVSMWGAFARLLALVTLFPAASGLLVASIMKCVSPDADLESPSLGRRSGMASAGCFP